VQPTRDSRSQGREKRLRGPSTPTSVGPVFLSLSMPKNPKHSWTVKTLRKSGAVYTTIGYDLIGSKV
jgi:hypothetical protein